MNNKMASVATLVVLGAGAIQVAVAIATITDPGIMIAFIVAIVVAVLVDAFVIHEMGAEPTNKTQNTFAYAMLAALLIGLSLDIVLLLTGGAFANLDFGFLRVLVGVNIAVSIVFGAMFFAASDTNTHERVIKKAQQDKDLAETNTFLNSREGALLFRVKTVANLLDTFSKELKVPVYKLTEMLDDPHLSALLQDGTAPVKVIEQPHHDIPRRRATTQNWILRLHGNSSQDTAIWTQSDESYWKIDGNVLECSWQAVNKFDAIAEARMYYASMLTVAGAKAPSNLSTEDAPPASAPEQGDTAAWQAYAATQEKRMQWLEKVAEKAAGYVGVEVPDKTKNGGDAHPPL